MEFALTAHKADDSYVRRENRTWEFVMSKIAAKTKSTKGVKA